MGIVKRLVVVSVSILASFSIVSSVFAETEGGGVSGGGENVGNCNGNTFISASCGAEWRYYKWGDSAPGVSYNGNSVTIQGWNGQMYARGYTLTNCNEGGFWRYAFVSNYDGNIDGYHKGDQVGLLGIGGGSADFLSQAFKGPVVNRNPSSWNQAKAVYLGYHTSDPANYPRGWDANSDLFVFCGTYDQSRTLKGVAVDYYGNNLGLDEVSNKVKMGSSATITRQNEPKGYTYRGWRKEIRGIIAVENNKYSVKNLNDDITVYSVYEKNVFEGKATSVNKDRTRTATTEWTSSDKTAETIYIDCPAIPSAASAECSASIQFEVRRISGSGTTDYTIYDNNGNAVSGYNDAKTDKEGRMSASFDVYLDAGDKKCYSMKARASEADNKWFTVEACVAAPYNFNNSTEVTISNDEIIFAGEQREISYNVTKGKRNNATVGKEYSTILPNAIHGLQVSYDSGNSWQPGYERPAETLSEENNERNGTVTFWDVDAGTNVCIRSYVVPANSGNDTNLSVAGFKGVAYSPDKAKCFLVAKRPNMQILGGSYYSGKKTETSTAIKHIDGAVKVFGSWGEQSVIGVGTISGFASGSANSSTLGSNTGFCQYRTLLTFNNIPCSGDATQNGIGVATANDNRDALVDYWVADSVKETRNGEVNVNDGSNTVQTIAGKNVQYTNTQDDIRVNGGTLPKGTTRIIKTSKNATIVDNIYYEDGYSGAADIPKMIISADNIEISCNVNRIDAILIAKNSVNTCRDYKSEGIANEDDRVTQLTVRGMVIANKLIPSRTYGAGTAAESGVPAEIINYDSSTMLWAQYMAGSDDSGALTVTYQRELAPRY